MRTENKGNLLSAVEAFLTGVAVAITVLNIRKISRLEEKIHIAKRDSRSILMFQNEKNREVRDEVSSVYEHIEECLKLKEDGR